MRILGWERCTVYIGPGGGVGGNTLVFAAGGGGGIGSLGRRGT